jgi:hypothetical protein
MRQSLDFYPSQSRIYLVFKAGINFQRGKTIEDSIEYPHPDSLRATPNPSPKAGEGSRSTYQSFLQCVAKLLSFKTMYWFQKLVNPPFKFAPIFENCLRIWIISSQNLKRFPCLRMI